MKKLIYLFLGLLIVACISDYGGEEEQTFLEKYNNSVFECENCQTQNDYLSPLYIGFTNSDNFLYYNDDLTNCYYIFEGNLNGLDIVNITENTINSGVSPVGFATDLLIYTKTYDTLVETYRITVTNGTSMDLYVTFPDGEFDSFFYNIAAFNVNDICN